MIYLKVFITGGLLCLIGQLLVDKTSLTPARILTSYVVSGVILTSVGIYQKIVDFGQCGATVPLLGFGYSMAKGTREAVLTDGFIGIFKGPLTAAAAGIAAAVFFSLIFTLFFKPRPK